MLFRSEVRGFVQAVGDGFVDQRVFGDADFAGQVFGAGDLIGEDAGQQVVGAHALNGRRDFAAAAEAGDGEGSPSVPFPAGAEHRGGQQGLREDVLDSVGVQEAEDDFERERVLVAEREHQAVVGRGGLDRKSTRLNSSHT
mgnify:CR=1 FL=1